MPAPQPCPPTLDDFDSLALFRFYCSRDFAEIEIVGPGDLVDVDYCVYWVEAWRQIEDSLVVRMDGADASLLVWWVVLVLHGFGSLLVFEKRYPSTS